MGWRLEEVLCFGLHAAPFTRLRPILTEGQNVLCLLRDGAAAGELAAWLTGQGFGLSRLSVLERLGGARERRRDCTAGDFDLPDVQAPVAVALQAAGAKGLPRTPGLPDDLFASDGVMTKRTVRALTLSALSPRAGEVLWDLGAGSGSVSVEWCLAAPGASAHAVEARADRLCNIVANAEGFGLAHRLLSHRQDWPEGLQSLARPDAVFIGGGANQAGTETLFQLLPAGVRLVMNAVTIETEMLLIELQQQKGGSLSRFDIAEAQPLGRMLGWVPARPVVQWSVTL